MLAVTPYPIDKDCLVLNDIFVQMAWKERMKRVTIIFGEFVKDE